MTITPAESFSPRVGSDPTSWSMNTASISGLEAPKSSSLDGVVDTASGVGEGIGVRVGVLVGVGLEWMSTPTVIVLIGPSTAVVIAVVVIPAPNGYARAEGDHS